MQIAISLEDNGGMDAKASSIFGRCAFFMIVDSESEVFEIKANTARQASGGAGIQAAQWIIDRGVTAVITGNLGPKAFDVLSTGKIAAFKHNGGSANDALKAYQQDALESLIAPNVSAHSGSK